MPWGLTRLHQSGQSHFVTFCCYHRRRLLTTDESRRIFESALERVAAQFQASRLRVRSHARACSPPAERTATGYAGRCAEVVGARSIVAFDRRCGAFLAKAVLYATGCEGRVEIESEWTARERERAAGRLCPALELPHSAKTGLEWATRPHRGTAPLVFCARQLSPSARLHPVLLDGLKLPPIQFELHLSQAPTPHPLHPQLPTIQHNFLSIHQLHSHRLRTFSSTISHFSPKNGP